MPGRIITPPTFLSEPSAQVAPPPSPGLGTGSRVWLVRHGEVHSDWHGRAYGNHDVPLSTIGEDDTRAMAAAFRGSALFEVRTSPLERAFKMGRAIADATSAPLLVDERLKEIWRGQWQGMPAPEFRRRWEDDRVRFLADPWTWKAHGGESDADVFARAWPALVESARGAAGATTVLACHYNVIRVLVTRALRLPLAQGFAFRCDPGHAALLVDARDEWKLARANVRGPDSSQPS